MMSEITRAVMGMPYDMAMGSELSRIQFYNIGRASFLRMEALEAENASLVEALQKIRFRFECFIEDDRDMRVASLEVVKSICDEAIAKALAQ